MPWEVDLLTNFSKFSIEVSVMKTDLFKVISHLDDSIFFQEIVVQRAEQIRNVIRKEGKIFQGDLADLFELDEARIVIEKTDLKNCPGYYDNLEKGAIEYFGNILNCWTEYEIYKYTQKARQEYEREFDRKYLNINGTRSEIIPDISDDKRFFKIHRVECPMRLSNAVVLCNLYQFVKEKKWYEMLFSIELSSRGRHFIYYSAKQNHLNILATALILRYTENNNWLTLNSFFQNDQWPPPKKEQLQSFLKDLDFDINFKKIKSYRSVKEFEHQFLRSVIFKYEIDEVIRMTVSVQSYGEIICTMLSALKELSRMQLQNGQKLSFFITEESPLILIARVVEKMTDDDNLFLVTSQRQIGHDDIKTCKGLFSHKKLYDTLSKLSFSEVMQNIYNYRQIVFGRLDTG